jgi:chromosome segregation ATPase
MSAFDNITRLLVEAQAGALDGDASKRLAIALREQAASLLAERIASIEAQHKQLEHDHEALEGEYEKLVGEYQQLKGEHLRAQEEYRVATEAHTRLVAHHRDVLDHVARFAASLSDVEPGDIQEKLGGLVRELRQEIGPGAA